MSDRTCVECPRKHYGRGWCRYHYQVNWLAGTVENRPRTLVRPDATLDERLRNIGWTVTAGGCWEWNGSRNLKNYGQLAQGTDRPIIASRAAYEAWVGPISAGLVVRHTCDNPPCMNPNHLITGTRAENSGDMVARKRSRNGERRPQHKLTDEQVANIRAYREQTGAPYAAIARMYGVSPTAIGFIVTGKRRPHPTYPIPKGQTQ